MAKRTERVSWGVVWLTLIVLTGNLVSAQTVTVDTPSGLQFEARAFSWGHQLFMQGAGWDANEVVTVHLYGPLNTLGFAPQDKVIRNAFLHTDTFTANGNGEIIGVLLIPYLDEAPQPGYYEIFVTGTNASHRASAGNYNIQAETRPAYPPVGVDWARSRGARDGWLGDISPERTDPEWIPVWTEKPVGMYASVTAVDSEGNNQPAILSHHEFPGTHYAHDFNLILTPDDEYRWILASGNYNNDPAEITHGRIELEWEALNNGRPQVGSYGQGVIGVPAWAIGTAGDRIYTVGRWDLDNGHPDSGDRSEIHPPRLLATMRKLQTTLPFESSSACVTRASQLDIYVSGHGGGVNQYPDGLSEATDNEGKGGGRIEDVLSIAEQDVYHAFGPVDSAFFSAVAFWFGQQNNLKEVAGPSAFGWGLGPEERPINDMNYDFDVPLPPAPANATAIRVSVTTHPEHTTAVAEQVTYIDPDPTTGLPRKAHIHLPYLNADNGIYGRTLNFFWDAYNPPGRHFTVKMNEFDYFMPVSMSGRAFMWSDIGGQWTFLTKLDPTNFLHAGEVLVVRNPGDAYHVYLDPTDTLRFFSLGYDQQGFDSVFGVDVGKPAYEVGLDLAAIAAAAKVSLNPNDGDNENLGGALLEVGPIPTLKAAGGSVGKYIVHSKPFYYFVDLNVGYVPDPRLGVAGVPVQFGIVPIGSNSDRTVRVSNAMPGIQNNDPYANAGVDTLHTNFSVTGAGFSLVPPTPTGFNLDAGQYRDLGLRYTATGFTTSVGSLNFTSDDQCQPTASYPLCAEGVPTGIRVLVKAADGTPYPVLDQLTINGVPHQTTNLKNLPLTTLNPPQSCETRQYHYRSALPPTGTGSGNSDGSYELRVRAANQQLKQNFTLAAGEFKDLVITLP